MASLGLEKYTAALRIFASFLSYGVVVGASILKVPQILKILKNRSAAGISLLSIVVEVLAYVISLSWGIRQKLAFADFGENGIIFLQLCVLLSLVAGYQGAKLKSVICVGLEVALMVALLNGSIPLSVHRNLLSGQIVLSLFSRVPQIRANFNAKSTGQLSFLTFFMAFGGGFARLLTTAMNVPWGKGKGVLLCQYGLSVFLNFIVLFQMLMYRSVKRKLE